MMCFPHDWQKANNYRYFVIGFIAKDQEEIIRYASLLRGTESAVQAVSVSLPCPNLQIAE